MPASKHYADTDFVESYCKDPGRYRRKVRAMERDDELLEEILVA